MDSQSVAQKIPRKAVPVSAIQSDYTRLESPPSVSQNDEREEQILSGVTDGHSSLVSDTSRQHLIDEFGDEANTHNDNALISQEAHKTLLTNATDANGKQPKQHHLSRFASAWSQTFLDTWFFEILCMVVSVLSFMSIVIVLKIHDDSPPPKYHSGITLNTIIATLATLGKSTLMVSVAGCLSQLKWAWFAGDERSLLDLQDYDDASRGLWGSTRLLIRARGLNLSSLGASVTIAAVAVSPFTQQIISYPITYYESGVATVGRTQNLTFTSLNAYDPSSPDYGLKSASLNALYSDINTPIPYTMPHCPTGNCTWSQDFQSLAVCASVANATSLLQGDYSNSTNFFPYPLQNPSEEPGFYIVNITSAPNTITVNDSLQFFPSLTWPNINAPMGPILDAFIIFADTNTGGTFVVEVILQYCINSYNVTITNSNLNVSISRTWDNFTLKPEAGQLVLSAPELDSVFSVEFQIHGQLQQYLQSIFNGTVKSHDNSDMMDLAVSFYSLFALNSNYNNDSWKLGQVNKLMNNFAQSYTNSFPARSGALINEAGISWSSQTLVHVQWAWLSFPLTLVLLGICFLISTIFYSHSKKMLLWKSSTIALLQVLDHETKDMLGSLEAPSKMENKVKGVTTSLRKEFGELDERWVLKKVN